MLKGTQVFLEADDITTRPAMYYNVTQRSVPVTTVVVGKREVLHNLSVYLQPHVSSKCARTVLYCHLWPTQLYHILPRTPHPPKKKQNKWHEFRNEKCYY